MHLRTSVSSSAKRRHFRRTFFRGTRAHRGLLSRARSLVMEPLENRLLLAACTVNLTGAGTWTLDLVSQGGTQAQLKETGSNAVKFECGESADFTAAAATDKLKSAAHGLQDDDIVHVDTTGTLPDPLTKGTDYYVKDRTDDEFKVSETKAGPAMNITTDGVGTHTWTLQSDTIDITQDSLIITGDGSAQRLAIDFANDSPIPQGGIVFDGGAGDDTLQIDNGDFTTVTTTYTNASDGNVDLDGDLVEFTGLTPVLINAGTINHAVFNLPAGPNTDVELSDNAVNGDGTSQIRGATFEDTDFTNPAGSLTVNLGQFADTITVKEMDGGFAPAGGILVNGGPGSDHLVVTDDGNGDVTLIRKGPHGQNGSAIVAPGSPTPLGPVVFESVELVQVTPINPVTGGTGTDGEGRVVELDWDPLEANDTRLNATPYDLLSRLHVQPAIDPGGDEDWYSFVAPRDSSYLFDLQFEEIGLLANGNPGLPGRGMLHLDIYDKDGTLLSGVPFDIDGAGFDHAGPIGAPLNALVANLPTLNTAAAPFRGISWSGLASPVDPATLGSEMKVQITHDQSAATATVQLGDGGVFPASTPFSGTSDALSGVLVNPGDTFSFEFLDDLDNIPGPDATWNSLSVREADSVTLSLQAQETYYARVRGATGTEVNLYNLDITDTRESFDNGAGQFEPLSGSWTIDREGLNASYRGASDPKDNAIALFKGPVPANNGAKVIEVTINSKDLVPGPRWSNAFVAFDVDPANLADFKFAGAFVGINNWAIGHSATNDNGYSNDVSEAERIDANTDYRIRVTLAENVAAVETEVILEVHDGWQWQEKTRHTYNELFADGVGLLTMRGIAWFDDFADPDPGRPIGDPDADSGSNAEDPDPVEPNTVPVAGDDSAATAFGQAVTVDVLANDADANSDPLIPTVVTAPTHGTVVCNPNGSFLYTPEPAFHGTDAFTYKVNDGQVDSEAATVSIIVSRPNDPPLAVDDSGHTVEDSPVSIDLLTNDSDPNADPLTVSAVTQGVTGSVIRNGDGTVTYIPHENFHGSDAFTYTVSDGRGGFDTGLVQVIVDSLNDAPLARADSAATEQDQTVSIDVLANDADADGDPLWITIRQSSGGAAMVNDGGTPNDASDDTVDFTPATAFHGTASFSYQISDGQVDSNAVEVVIAVARINHGPVALDDQFATNEDASVSIDVLTNDFDTDNDPLTLVSFSQGSHGQVMEAAGNTLTYTPQADFHGVDAFTYQISDGYGGTTSATVNVIVNPMNDAPVARDDAASTDSDTAVTIDVTSNDFDPDGDPRSIQSVTDGTHGTVVNNSDETVTYDPKAGYSGLDSFSYTISDGNGGTSTASVVVSVGSVVYEQDFDDEILDGLDTKLGNWQITDDLFAASPGDRSYTGQAASNGNAIVAQAVDGTFSNLELTVTLNAEDKIPGRRWSNAFVIFDYQSPTDFKFAGTFVGLDRWVIGHYAPNANGYIADKVFSEGIDTLTDYAVQVLVEGDTVTLAVHDGQHYLPKVTHTYADPGDSLQDGSVGVGTMRGVAHFDDLLIKATDRVFGEVGSAT